MRVALFCHSLLSDWNHGNAHFLRGVVGELTSRGHEVRTFEPKDAWSLENLVAEAGEKPLEEVRSVYPFLSPTRYDKAALDLEKALDGVSLILVHEWNDPDLVQRLGAYRARHPRGARPLPRHPPPLGQRPGRHGPLRPLPV